MARFVIFFGRICLLITQSAQNYNQQQQRLPSLNIPQSPAAYSPAALSAAINATANAAQNRTVYIGNLPATASVDELLNLVHFGPLENIRVLPEKSCVFLSFLDGPTAAAFHADATIKKLSLHGQELKVGWGKPSPVPAQVQLAISQSNASRNVYVGGLDENMTEEQLRDELSRFGLIDQVKIVRDKNNGFVHFLSIAVATKVRHSTTFPYSFPYKFPGRQHAAHRAQLGWKARKLWQGSLCLHSQIPAGRRSTSAGCCCSVFDGPSRLSNSRLTFERWTEPIPISLQRLPL